MSACPRWSDAAHLVLGVLAGGPVGCLELMWYPLEKVSAQQGLSSERREGISLGRVWVESKHL